MDFDHSLLSILGIPFLGKSAFLNLTVARTSYDLFFHHGIDSGVALRTKIAKAEQFNAFTDADAIFTAHSHVAIELQPSALRYADNVGMKAGTKMRRGYICGSSYDSRTGYAEDFGYPPLLPSYIAVDFGGKIVQGYAKKEQQYTRWLSEGDYELKHDYIEACKSEDVIHG